ncbi:hypothetical protein D3C73_808510 [compost metagenome]
MVDQRLHEGCLAAAGGTGNHDVLVVLHGLLEEVRVVALRAQLDQLPVMVAERGSLFEDLTEETVILILLQRLAEARRQTDGDRYAAGITCRRNDELRALPGRECQRHHWIGVGDALPRIAFVDHGSAELTRALERQRRNFQPLPTRPGFQVQLSRLVDTDLGDVGRMHVFADPEDLVLVIQKSAGHPGGGGFGVHFFCRMLISGSRKRSRRRVQRRHSRSCPG